MKFLEWMKNNKLVTVLILVIVFLLVKDKPWIIRPFSKRTFRPGLDYERAVPETGAGLITEKARLPAPLSPSSSTPHPEVKNRLVIEESNLSLVVENVRQKVDQITNYVVDKNGYMVSSSITQPQEAPFATLVVRVPKDKLKETIEYLRGLAIKVTSENLKGRDVTDEYFDLEARMETLTKTQAKFEEILDKATTVDQILKVQREIINLQEQIDRLKGRQKYLEKTAENAKLTVYLSTDEWALPYAPEPGFRPKVVFKQSVRSLVKTLRSLGKGIIWLGVYSVLWLPLLLVWWIWKRRKKA